jgi:hypothetical protein
MAIVFGPVADPKGGWGVAILRARDAAEIAELQQNDPAIRAGLGFTCVTLPMPRAVVSTEKSIFFLLSAVVTWFLGGLSRREQRALAPISWALFVSYVASTYLAVRWFFFPPVVFSSLITGLLGFECIRLNRPIPAQSTD